VRPSFCRYANAVAGAEGTPGAEPGRRAPSENSRRALRVQNACRDVFAAVSELSSSIHCEHPGGGRRPTQDPFQSSDSTVTAEGARRKLMSEAKHGFEAVTRTTVVTWGLAEVCSRVGENQPQGYEYGVETGERRSPRKNELEYGSENRRPTASL